MLSKFAFYIQDIIPILKLFNEKSDIISHSQRGDSPKSLLYLYYRSLIKNCTVCYIAAQKGFWPLYRYMMAKQLKKSDTIKYKLWKLFVRTNHCEIIDGYDCFKGYLHYHYSIHIKNYILNLQR